MFYTPSRCPFPNLLCTECGAGEKCRSVDEHESFGRGKEKSAVETIKKVQELYLGPDFDREVEAYIEKKKIRQKFTVKKATPRMVAELLAQGEIIARCTGRMEWGAR